MIPLYIKNRNEVREKEKRLKKLLSPCQLCPRKCRVKRLKGERGFCGGGEKVTVSSYFPHFGEEACLVGKYGSGTIFFSHCNLKCVFCQNYEISHRGEGKEVSPQDLAEMMLYLQKLGCHNINLVTPTHFVPQIITALIIALEEGLKIPLVYNCGGYESEEVIDLLEGIMDIYMPDTKFSSSLISERFASAPDYFENLKIILKKMHQQVGDLVIENGIAQRGLLIRHLVMPNALAETKEIMEFIAQEVSSNSYINIMSQYRPCGEAYCFPEINRAITQEEFFRAKEIALSLGLNRLD
ncbi:MAG: radical SAM protein [Candidatus Omnitrophica bacterium]|nr:radical SAM protein [Candidatus Omnitrophota bacterium]MCM8799006.1 radical SAM protein [Candidatus Omnitrophota bacterium]